MRDLNYEYVCKDFANKFFTRRDDLITEIEDLGYEVLEDFGEYISIDEGNGSEWLLYIATAGKTMWVAYVKERN